MTCPILWPASLAQWQHTNLAQWQKNTQSPLGMGKVWLPQEMLAEKSNISSATLFQPPPKCLSIPCTCPCLGFPSLLASWWTWGEMVNLKALHAYLHHSQLTALGSLSLFTSVLLRLWASLLQGQWAGAQQIGASQTNACVTISHSKVPQLMNYRAKIRTQCISLGPVFKTCVAL